MSDETQSATGTASPAAAAAPQPPPAETPVLDRLMHLADQCLHNYELRQAAEMYFDMLNRPGAGPHETDQARRHLLEIAAYYEETGKPHQARGIYERLL
ncbi:MAG: hypothetical protein ACLQVA_03625 [Candidatus Brocadiia bacterium]